MTNEIKPTPRPTPEELTDVQITPEMVASWVAYDKIQESKARQERQEEHDLEAIERELIAEGVADKDARAVAPEIRAERIKEAASKRAKRNEWAASRQVRQMF
jgi:hypothetical protein